MVQAKINFSKPYVKLVQPIFPTIRGKSWFEKNALLYLVTQTSSSKKDRLFLGFARLKHKYLMNISDIPLSFLQYDAYPEPIYSHHDFAELLNEFRFYSRAVTPIDEVTVLIFEWTHIRRLDEYLSSPPPPMAGSGT